MTKQEWLQLAQAQAKSIYNDLDKIELVQDQFTGEEKEAAIQLVKQYMTAIEFLQFAVKAVNRETLMEELAISN